MENEVENAIKSRRSIRKYSDTPIDKSLIIKMIETVCQAPSGKNLQPWKFVVVNNEKIRREISELSKYKKWMVTAPCYILVYMDNSLSYERIKDIQAIGACVQNILLMAHSLNLGSCWVGEIVRQDNTIKDILQISDNNLELMALLTIGYAMEDTQEKGWRRSINDSILMCLN